MPNNFPSRRAMTWGGMAFVVAALYFTRQVCIPLALALLLSFLLGPLVLWLGRLGVGRVLSVILVVTHAIALVGFLTWLLASQVYDLASKLPQYESNMQTKLQSLSKPGGGIVSRSARVLRHLSREISNAGKTAEAETSSHPTTQPPAKPVPVEIYQPNPSAVHVLRNLVSRLINPLLTAGIVIVFVIFMLIKREDLRDRLIRLVGAGQLNVTTQALDDAAHGVSRYLLAQFIVNLCYGIAIGIGLFFVGIPNPLLWGLMATLLRFIPYAGPWLAAITPVALAFAVDPGWGKLFGTLGVFVGVELLTYNFLEPWFYSSRTGLSAIAVLGAAVFWTWLWGPVGLLLATPLTVCLVVLGRYVPRLEFLGVLLGDEPVLPVETRFYQRLLAMNYDEAIDLAEQFVTEKSIRELYEDVVIPALTLAEADRHRGVLSPEQEKFIFETTRELIQELPEREKEGTPDRSASGSASILCLPAADEGDEIAGLMLAQLLAKRGIAAKNIPASALASERLELVQQEQVSVVCISALPPGAAAPARYLCKRIRADFPHVKIIVAVWHANVDLAKLQHRIGPSLADGIVTTLSQAVEHLAPIASPENSETSPRTAVPEQPTALEPTHHG